MTKLRCCFCQQELEEDIFFGGRVFVSCNNPNCIISDWGGCSKQIITELIRTRKALDAAKRWLMQIGYLNMSEHGLGSEKMMTDWCKTVALYGLKEIETALEQKD